MKRNYEVRVKLSKEELQMIKQKSELLGLPVSSYLRFLGLNSKIKPE